MSPLDLALAFVEGASLAGLAEETGLEIPVIRDQILAICAEVLGSCSSLVWVEQHQAEVRRVLLDHQQHELRQALIVWLKTVSLDASMQEWRQFGLLASQLESAAWRRRAMKA